MDITLYKNFSVPNKINKNISQVAKYSAVQLVESVNDLSPSIRIAQPTDSLKWSNVNYFEWDGAYYFLDSVDKTADGLSVVNGRMDWLMTYKSAIEALSVLPERSTSHGSPRLEDQNRRVTVDSERTVLNFPEAIPGSEAMGVYVVTTAQSGYTIHED